MSDAGLRHLVADWLMPVLVAGCMAGLASSTALSRVNARPAVVNAPSTPSALLAERPQMTAGSLDFDGRSNSLVLTDVRISTQNGYVIQAGEAQTSDANDFNNSRWTFKNKVEITTPQGHTSSEVANVSFAQNQISELHMTGSPATFEQFDTAKQTIARGQAGAIDYDLKQNTVRLSNDAWIKYGQNECRAVTLSYNIEAQRVSAKTEEQNGQRVNCTISPASTNPGATDTNSAGAAATTLNNNTAPAAITDTP